MPEAEKTLRNQDFSESYLNACRVIVTGSRCFNDFGFVTCKQDNGWKLVRITQFPACSYTVLGEVFSSSEEAMESIGVYDCGKYLREGEVIVAGDS